MSDRWTPFDFILNGEFASPDHLRGLTAHARTESDAVCALLLVHHADDIVQSLFYLVTDRDDDGSLQMGVTNHQPKRTEVRHIEQLLDAPKEGTVADLVGADLGEGLFRSVRETWGNERARLFRSKLEPRLKTVHLEPARVGVLCINPKRDVPSEILDELAIAVHASAPVYLYRVRDLEDRARRSFGDRLETDLEGRFQDSISEADDLATGRRASQEPRSMFSGFMTAVLRFIGATHGAVYMKFDKEKLVSATRLGFDSGGQFVDFPTHEIDVHGRGVVAKAARIPAVILFNDADDFRRMTPKIGLLPFSTAPIVHTDAELAIPLIDQSKERPELLGVLNIEKDFRRPMAARRPFSLQDCWVLQEALNRLAARWTHELNEAIYRMLDNIKKQFRPYDSRQPQSERRTSPSPESAELPSDYAAIRERLGGLISPFCRTVPTIYACSIRTFSIDQSKLVIVNQYPPDLAGVPPSLALRGSEPTPQERVVLDGEPRSGWAKELPTKVERLASYYCLPLSIETRCVGAVTFGSEHPESILKSQKALIAVTEAIANAIEITQKEALARVLGPRFVELLRELHDVKKIPSDVRKHLEKVKNLVNELTQECGSAQPAGDGLSEHAAVGATLYNSGPTATLIKSSLDGIDGKLAVLERYLKSYEYAKDSDEYTPEQDRSYSVRGLVDELLNETKAKNLFNVVDELPPGWENLPIKQDRLTPRVYGACFGAMIDLVRNATTSMTDAIDDNGVIYIHERRVGGRRYACITLRNRTRSPLPPTCRARLYREPFRMDDGDRLHYGAFLSAWLIRSVGGEVHLERLPGNVSGADESRHTFCATVEIPIPPLQVSAATVC